MDRESDVVLAGDFPPATRDAWRQLVAGVLAKSGITTDPEQALATATYDGFDLQPLYTAADRPADFVWPNAATGPGWDIRQHHAGPDPARVNRAILTDLENGVTSIWLALGPGGLAVGDLPRVLEGVLFDLAPVALDAGPLAGPAARALLALVGAADLTGSLGLSGSLGLNGSLGLDPIGLLARTGAAPDLAGLVEIATLVRDRPGLTAITVDGPTYHDAGAGDADEVAIATAVAVAYVRALTDAGWDVVDAFATIEFRFAVTGDQFASVAKLRAARRVWDRVGELCGLAPAAAVQRQHAVTSRAMLTRRDPWVNLLRATVACFGAVVGGADAVSVAPFDSAIGYPDDFGRRIARNTQSILQDESSLGRVSDPAAGSWYVESRTDQVAHSAWAEFTNIERLGGVITGLDMHLRGLIGATQGRRADAINHRSDPITGVTEFAFPAEAKVERAPYPPAAATGSLRPRRWAEDFEALRDRADAAATRPRVFLAALGPPATYSGRVGFARNLFNAGGIESVLGDGSIDEIVAAFGAAGTPLACLCSSDRLYGEQGDEVEAALIAAGATSVWRAGREFAVGSDAYDLLHRAFQELRV
jgi:methylmalonyl-CoA mutase